MMFATPTPAMSSVNAPTSPMKIWMPSPTAVVSFSSSMKSHMPRARWSVGSKLYFRPSTRYSSALTMGPRDASRGCTMRWLTRSEEHTSELQSRLHLVCRLLLEKKKEIVEEQRASYHPVV